MRIATLVMAALLGVSPLSAQTPNDPFPAPIPATDGVISVGYRNFATPAGGQRTSGAADAAGR